MYFLMRAFYVSDDDDVDSNTDHESHDDQHKSTSCYKFLFPLRVCGCQKFFWLKTYQLII